MERVGASSDDLQHSRHLSELREMRLLSTAEIVDHQLEAYLHAQGIDLAWGTQERILVCLTSHADAKRMIASGRRNAERFRGTLLVMHVHMPGLSDADQAVIDQ